MPALGSAIAAIAAAIHKTPRINPQRDLRVLMKWTGMQSGPKTTIAVQKLASFQARASCSAGRCRRSRRRIHHGTRMPSAIWTSSDSTSAKPPGSLAEFPPRSQGVWITLTRS